MLKKYFHATSSNNNQWSITETWNCFLFVHDVSTQTHKIIISPQHQSSHSLKYESCISCWVKYVYTHRHKWTGKKLKVNFIHCYLCPCRNVLPFMTNYSLVSKVKHKDNKMILILQKFLIKTEFSLLVCSFELLPTNQNQLKAHLNLISED